MVLAQIIGPILLALGVGIYLSPAYYKKLYRNLENETVGVVLAGAVILAAGISMVHSHNVWGTPLEIIISFLGLASIVKGIILLAYPKMADQFGDSVANTSFFSILAPVVILLGGYVSYVAYFA